MGQGASMQKLERCSRAGCVCVHDHLGPSPHALSVITTHASRVKGVSQMAFKLVSPTNHPSFCTSVVLSQNHIELTLLSLCGNF